MRMSGMLEWSWRPSPGLLLIVLCQMCHSRTREDQIPVDIIGEILHPNRETSPNEPDGANQFASHRGHLMAKDMSDSGVPMPATVSRAFF